MTNKSFSCRSRLHSIRYALNGLIQFFQQEHNAWIHLAATVSVAALAFHFHIQGGEIIALVVVTGMVWVAEAFNTVIERIMDMVSPQRHPAVAFIKDLSAGAVLLSALTATVTGAIVFIPKLF